MDKMSSSNYIVPYQKFMSCLKSYFDGYKSLLANLSVTETAKVLASASRCLILGPSSGESEIELIKRLMPNLQNLTAFEPDEPGAAGLRKNLHEHLPQVVSEVHNEKLQKIFEWDFDTNRARYDVVTIFHVLYHVSADDRRALFDELSKCLLNPGGIVIVFHVGRCNTPGNLYETCTHLSPTKDSCLLTDDAIQSDMKNAGFNLVQKDEFACPYDFRYVDQKLADFYTTWLGHTTTIEQLNESIRQVWPDGTSQSGYVALMCFQK